MRIKLLPFIASGILLASGLSASAEPLPLQLKALKLRASVDSLSTVKNPNEEKKSIAEELFGMTDNGKTYILANYAIAPIEVNGVTQKVVAYDLGKYEEVDEFNPDGSFKRKVRKWQIFDFYDDFPILKYGNVGEPVTDYEGYFKDGEQIVFKGIQWLPEYVEYSRTLTDEQKTEIKKRCERRQTLEEVIETLLMIDPDIKGWHTRKPPVIVELGTTPNNRQGELVWDSDLGGTYATTTDGKRLCLFLEMYETDTGDYKYREPLTKSPVCNLDMTEIDPDFARNLNIVSIDSPYYLVDFIREDKIAKEILTKFINDAKVKQDGMVYYDIGKLAEAYAQLPDEYKIDFSKLMNGASKYFFYVDPVTGRIFNITASSEEESDKKKSLVA